MAAFGPQHLQHLQGAVVQAEVSCGHSPEKLARMDRQSRIGLGTPGLKKRLEHFFQPDLGMGLVAVLTQGGPARRTGGYLLLVGRAQRVGCIARAVIAVKPGQSGPGGGVLLVGVDIHKGAVQIKDVIAVGKSCHDKTSWKGQDGPARLAVRGRLRVG